MAYRHHVDRWWSGRTLKGSGSPMVRNTARMVALALSLAAVVLALAPAAGAVTLSSPLASFLNGVVRGADGAPLPGIAVEVYANGAGSTGSEYVGQTLSSPDGRWLMPAPLGTYTVFFSDRTDERVVERRGRVAHDTLDTDLDVTLADPARRRSVTGRVLDSTGAPLEGTPVTLYHLFDPGPGGWAYVVEAGSTTTDVTGRYLVSTSEGSGYVSVAASVEGRRVGLAGGAVAADPGLATRTPVTGAGDLVVTDPPLTASGSATVAGEPAVGTILTAVTPRYNRSPDMVEVRWLRDGRTIANGWRYVPVAADLGRRLTVEATATSGAERVASASRAVVVRRAASSIRALVGAGVTAGRPSTLRVRVISASGLKGRIEVRVAGRTIGAAAHHGAATTRVPLRALARGRHVMRLRYTGDAVTVGSTRTAVLRVVAP